MKRLNNDLLMKMATYASVATASLLIVAKLVAWIVSGHLVILASLVDSAMDVAASVINLLAVRYSLKPADERHRFGHGKAEALAGLGQASFIFGSSVFLVFQAAERFVSPRSVTDSNIGIYIMLFAIVATTALIIFQSYVVKRTGSTAIKADSLHYRTDLLTNISTVLILLLMSHRPEWSFLDPLSALVIAIYIMVSAWKIWGEAVSVLMDAELEEDKLELIASAIARQPEVLSFHDLRTRRSGQHLFVQVHIDLPRDLPLADAHHISELIVCRIRRFFPKTDITIHLDPVKKTLHARSGKLE